MQYNHVAHWVIVWHCDDNVHCICIDFYHVSIVFYSWRPFSSTSQFTLILLSQFFIPSHAWQIVTKRIMLMYLGVNEMSQMCKCARECCLLGRRINVKEYWLLHKCVNVQENVDFCTNNCLMEVGKQMVISSAEARVDVGPLSNRKSAHYAHPVMSPHMTILELLNWSHVNLCVVLLGFVDIF
jgi:hypothetical protein